MLRCRSFFAFLSDVRNKLCTNKNVRNLLFDFPVKKMGYCI